MSDRVRTRRTSTRFSSSPSTGSSLSPSTWGRLAGDFAPAYHEVLTPLPNYDESLNVPVLTQTYFSTPQFEGKVIPKHLREKAIGRFIQLALTILTFGIMLTDIHRYVPATLLWGHLLSMYILIATHVLDDSSSGISAKSYRWTHFVFEATASLCWSLLLIITPWTFINNVSLLVTSILIPLIWFIHLAYSGYVLFYLKNIEQDEGVFPNLVVREDGRVMPNQDIMSWLAQPRNKARLILSYIYLLINLWDSSQKGEAQVIAALNLAVCLVFCLDGAWRGKMSLGKRVLMELCYDSGINTLLVVLVTASRFHHDSSYDQSIDFFVWTAVLFHLYVTGWNVNRYLSRDGRWNSMITKFVSFIDSIPFLKYVFEAGLPRQATEEQQNLVSNEARNL